MKTKTSTKAETTHTAPEDAEKTASAAPEERPTWDPMKGFPVDLSAESLPGLVGVLLAVTEHLQVVAMSSKRRRDRREYGTTLSGQLHDAAIGRPSMHVNTLLRHARLHVTRSRRRAGIDAFDTVLDCIMAALPDELPLFIPIPERYRAERSYRVTFRHLKDSYAAFRAENDAWWSSDEDDDEEEVA